MLYRSIRGLKKKVSALSIGSWSTFERMEFEDIIDVLGTCLEGGVNLIDDCRYGLQPGVPAGIPTTEVIVGQALKALGVGRDTYMLATKLWWDKYPRLTLRQQLLQAMRRLDVQHIELVYVDRPDRFVEKELEIHGSFAYKDEFGRVIDLMEQGAIDKDLFVSHTFTLEETLQAFHAQLDKDSSLKVMVEPERN